MSETMCVCGEDPVGENYDGLCRDCWLGICLCAADKHPPRRWAVDPDDARHELDSPAPRPPRES